MTSAPVTATLWGGAAMLTGAAGTLLLALPLKPADEGWDVLGWAIITIVVGAAVALLAGAVAVHQGLRRSGAEHPGRTALAFVPTALLLGAVTAGVGALAAPAVAHWLVDGFTRRAGWGPRPVAQRVVVAVVLSVLLAGWGLGEAGYELGGRVNGAVLTWLAVLPAVVVPPALLLARRVPWPLLLGGTVAAAVLLGLAVPQAVRDAHPTPERLQQVAQELPVPAGQEVTDVRTTVVRDEPWTVPVTVLSTAGDVPPLTGPLPASPAGRAAAERWRAVLAEQGWARSEQTEAYWLPRDLQQALAGHPQHEQGLWVRASVLPYGDGALVVLSARP